MTIGIISNPYSGKDIRRLVSSAIVTDNNEKTNIIERAILGTQSFGPVDIVMNPDKNNTARKINKRLKNNFDFTGNINVLNYPLLENEKDSLRAAEWMASSDDIKCVIVLGGDGTNRIVGKSNIKKPIISISTGTNNVYPKRIEGTVAGIAAAVIQNGDIPLGDSIRQDKRINIYKNGVFEDIALVDAVLTKEIVIGSKAVLDLNLIELVVVTRSHPASTGFSSILGSHLIISPEENKGAYSYLHQDFPKVITAAAPGSIVEIPVQVPEILTYEDVLEVKIDKRGVIALDGEREIIVNEGDIITFEIKPEGPIFAETHKVIEKGFEAGYFKDV